MYATRMILRTLKKVLLGEGRLVVDKNGEAPSRAVKLAAVALLIEVAAGDEEFDAKERREIIRDISFEFGISSAETKELMEDAEEIRSTHISLKPLVDILTKQMTKPQRVEVLSLLWRVADADGVIEEFEEVFTKSLIPQLGLNEQEAEQAVQRAKHYIKEGVWTQLNI